MYCSRCGNKLKIDDLFCTICGNQVAIECNEDLEIMIKEGLCNRVKSVFFVQNGHGMLTNEYSG